MIKKISELTEYDKQLFLEATKRSIEREHGVEWADIEKRMLDEIDATFDDERFSKMNPDFAIDAAYARKYFRGVKPSLVDYMLWSATFVTGSEYVEIEEKADI